MEPSCTRGPATRRQWHGGNKPTMHQTSRCKWSEKMNNPTRLFKSMSVHKKKHIQQYQCIYTLTSMCPVFLCVQVDETGGINPRIPLEQSTATERTEAQGGCGR